MTRIGCGWALIASLIAWVVILGVAAFLVAALT